MGYDAFISYSHSADGRLAPAVQTGLQRLARPWYRRRALYVFRDESGLTVNPHLWGSIAHAMSDSNYFVLLASPEAAASPWVNREIEHWCAQRGPEHILPVLTDGTLVWDNTRGEYDVDASSALPAALVGKFADEPRHLDLRWARYETQLDVRHGRFRDAIAALAAPMHGVPKEELESEDVRRQRGAVRLAWIVALSLVALTVAALAASVYAVTAARQADEQRRAANVERARADRNADRAQEQEALAKKNAADATTNAAQAEAYANDATENAAQADANAKEAHRNAEEAQANAGQARLLAANLTSTNSQLNDTVTQLNVSNENLNDKTKQLNDTNVDLSNTNASLREQTNLALARQLAAASLSTFDASPDLALLEAVEANKIVPTRDARDALLHHLVDHPQLRRIIHPPGGSATTVAVSPDGSRAATTNADGTLSIWNRATGREQARTNVGPVANLVFGPHNLVAASSGSSVSLIDAATGKLRWRKSFGVVEAVAFALGHPRMAIASSDRDHARFAIEQWDITATPKRLERFDAGQGCVLFDGDERFCDVKSLRYSRDGSQLAWSMSELFFVERAAVSTILVRPDGGTATVAGEVGDGFVSDLVFTPDQRTVQFAVSRTGVYHLTDQESFEHDGEYLGVTADGSLAVSTLRANGAVEVRMRNIRTKAPIGAPVVVTLGDFALAEAAPAMAVVDTNGQVRDLDYRRSLAPRPRRHEYEAGTSSVALSHDGRTVAFSDERMKLVDPLSGRTWRVLSGPSYTSEPVFSDDDRYLAAKDYGPGQESVVVWDVRDGHLVGSITVGMFIWDLAVSADDPTTPQDDAALAVSGEGDDGPEVRIWRLSDQQLVGRQPPHRDEEVPPKIEFDATGTLVAAWDRDRTTEFVIWDGRNARSFLAGPHISALAVNRQGTRLAVSRGETVSVLRMADGHEVGSFAEPARVLSFSPDGTTLVTGGTGVREWDVETLQPIGPELPIPEINARCRDLNWCGVSSIGLEDDGTLASMNWQTLNDFGDENTFVTRWDVGDSALVREACRVANRRLTEREWQLLIGSARQFTDANAPCVGYRRT